MTQIAIDELVWDKKIYPRPNKSNKTIDAYVEAMQIGASFPPLEVQRVSNYVNGSDEPQEAWLITDGVHRLCAYQELGKKEDFEPVKEIMVEEWQPGVILDYAKSWIDLKLRGAEKNTEHGDRLSDGNKKAIAQDIADNDPDITYTEEVIAAKLKVVQQSVNGWIKEIRARQRASRDSVIIRLSRLGWTQEEIAGVVGIDQSVISKNMQNTDFGKLHIFLSEGRSMEWIAEHYSIDLALAWALRLESKTDKERFGGATKSGEKPRELGWGIRTWDNWNFNKCDERFGDNWPGQIPAQLIAHTLFFFTQEGDLIFDPMAGGGVVPDTCLAFGRKCRAYDLATRRNRPEIQQHYWQLNNMTWPELKKKPDLIFFDPPYFDKKKDDYEDKAAETEDTPIPISSLSRSDYLRFFEQFFALAKENTKPTARLAFLNADWREFQSTAAIDEDPGQAITILDYADLLKNAGWIITHIIDCPLSSQRFEAGIVDKMQDNRTLGVVRRTLLIVKKG